MGTKRAIATAVRKGAKTGDANPRFEDGPASTANLSAVRTPVEGLALALLAIEEGASEDVAASPLLAAAHLEGKALVEAPGVGYTTVYGAKYEEVVNELLAKPADFEDSAGCFRALYEAVSEAMLPENQGILPQQAPAKIPAAPKRRGRPPKDPNAPPRAPRSPGISKKLEFAPLPRPKRIATVVARVLTALGYGCDRVAAAASNGGDPAVVEAFRKNLDLVDRLGTPGAWRATREMAIALHVWDRAGAVLRGQTEPMVLDYYAEEKRIVEAEEMGRFEGTTQTLAEAIQQALKSAGAV